MATIRRALRLRSILTLVRNRVAQVRADRGIELGREEVCEEEAAAVLASNRVDVSCVAQGRAEGAAVGSWPVEAGDETAGPGVSGLDVA